MLRDYQATALTHGKLYTLFMEHLHDLMQRQQYIDLLKPAYNIIKALKAMSLIRYFGQVDPQHPSLGKSRNRIPCRV